MSGHEQLTSFIERVRGCRGLPAAAAKESAPLVEAALKKTAAAGTTPTGTPWPAKKDGGRPLEHAADHITVAAAGSVVLTTLTGPDAFHQQGAQNKPRREVIPTTAEIPPVVLEALEEGAARAFRKISGAE